MAILSNRSALVVLALLLLGRGLGAQAPATAAAPSAPERGPQALSPEAVQSAINALGAVDVTASGNASGSSFSIRMNAARALRRAPAAAAAPALIHAVESHT